MIRSHTRSQDLQGARLEAWIRRTPWRPDTLDWEDLLRALQADSDPLRALPWLASLATRPVLVEFHAAEWSGATLSLVHRALDTSFPFLFLITVDPAGLQGRPVERSWLERIEAAGAVVHRLGPLGRREGALLVESIVPLDPSQRERLVEVCRGVPKRIVRALAEWTEREVFIETGARLRVPEIEFEALGSMAGEVVTTVPRDLPSSAMLLAVFGGRATEEELVSAARHAAISPAIKALLATGHVHTDAELVVLDEALVTALVAQARDAGRLSALNHAASAALEPFNTIRCKIRRARHLRACGEPEQAATVLSEVAFQCPEDAAYPLYQEWEQALHAAGVAEDDPRWLEGWSRQISRAYLDGSGDPWVSDRCERVLEHGSRRQRANARLYLSITTAPAAAASERSWREFACDEGLSFDTRARAALQIGFRALQRAQLAEVESWVDLADSLVQLRGRHCQQLGELVEARAYLEHALRIPSGKLEMVTWNVLGDVCRDQGDRVAAERCYRRGLAISRSLGSPNQFFSELNLILLALQRGELHAHLPRIEGLAADIRAHLWRAYAVFPELLCLALPKWSGRVASELSRITTLLHELDFTDVELATVATLSPS